jgi:hypothetical protein
MQDTAKVPRKPDGRNRPLSVLRRAMTPHGTLVIVGGERGGGRALGGFDRQLIRAPLVSMFTGQRLRGLTAKEDAEDLEAITRHAGHRPHLRPRRRPLMRSAASPRVTPRARSS